MIFDLLDDFMAFDFAMGADVVKCPHCKAGVPCSLFFDDNVKCPECEKMHEKDNTVKSSYMIINGENVPLS